jgi:hypothetical protein
LKEFSKNSKRNVKKLFYDNLEVLRVSVAAAAAVVG